MLPIGEGNGNPLQYSCLENPMDGGAWWAIVHRVMKIWARLNNFTLTFHFHALEKDMATHSSVFAWRIPGTGSLVGCRLWGRTKSDTTEVTQQQQQQHTSDNLLNFLFMLDKTLQGRNHLHLQLRKPRARNIDWYVKVNQLEARARTWTSVLLFIEACTHFHHSMLLFFQHWSL